MKIGQVCRKHPELKGRRTNNNSCTGCKRVKDKARRETPDGVKRNAAVARRYADALKKKVYDHYGNKCTRCGFDNPDALTIEHENQKGADHRRAIGVGGRRIHKWLVDHNFPPGFTILCQNCNTIAYKEHLRERRG